MSFASLGLSELLVRAVHDKGYTQPTPIQTQAIPAILQGQDIMAAAQTGTGKTAGFTLPLLQRLEDGAKVKPNCARALVLTPTRELAAQVHESVQTYGAHLPLRSAVVFGGVSINPQMKLLRRGVDVLVATPGRLLDLHQQNAIRFDQISILVLDEADRMLDMGFIHDIRKVLALLPPVRQNLLFSATFSGDIRDLARGLLRNPVEVDVAPRNSTAERVEQVVHPVDRSKKAALLSHLIRRDHWEQAIVFTRTKHGANKLVEYLMRDGISAAAIHSNKSQGARTKALAEFKQGEIAILVATDIAARGLDIPQLPQVVNFDLPNVPEDYVHRIGRTGRAGETGHAISLVDAEESRQLADIELLTRQRIPREQITEFQPLQPLQEVKPSRPRRDFSRNQERQQKEALAQPNGEATMQENQHQQQRPHKKPQRQRTQGNGNGNGNNNGGNGNNGQKRNGQHMQNGKRPHQGQGQRAQQQNGRGRPQDRNQSQKDQVLLHSPMTQRMNESEQHRLAQSLGNRMPTPEEMKKLQAEHQQRQQQRPGGHHKQGQQRRNPQQQQPIRNGETPPRKQANNKRRHRPVRQPS